jgi:hypothetical protein
MSKFYPFSAKKANLSWAQNGGSYVLMLDTKENLQIQVSRRFRGYSKQAAEKIALKLNGFCA